MALPPFVISCRKLNVQSPTRRGEVPPTPVLQPPENHFLDTSPLLSPVAVVVEVYTAVPYVTYLADRESNFNLAFVVNFVPFL